MPLKCDKARYQYYKEIRRKYKQGAVIPAFALFEGNLEPGDYFFLTPWSPLQTGLVPDFRRDG